jgi:hypothetical protein
VLVSIASFATYTLLGGKLSPAVAFPALALLDMLQYPVTSFPEQIINLVAARVAQKRLQVGISCPATEQIENCKFVGLRSMPTKAHSFELFFASSFFSLVFFTYVSTLE